MGQLLQRGQLQEVASKQLRFQVVQTRIQDMLFLNKTFTKKVSEFFKHIATLDIHGYYCWKSDLTCTASSTASKIHNCSGCMSCDCIHRF